MTASSISPPVGLPPETEVFDLPRRFMLVRHEDVSGVSGTGVVAWGVMWPDGTASTKWNGDISQFANWCGGIFELNFVHGHNGKTVIEWID